MAQRAEGDDGEELVMDPQPGNPLRHVVLDDPTERLPPRLALPLVAVETLTLTDCSTPSRMSGVH